ncbi:hypothetical protein LSUE1_G008167 [Lachnellula suecica]|uniref:F-box domain-containing protein n=1 Tax=Lachnellula suecica TaxID=602035 RepID=A0A8T9C7D5_9HELO|nr:hypothetical protein LSUE1_G008167 [Lachnellula suecica]
MDAVKPTLHNLPPETLQQIASHLDGSHRPSLYAFGLTSTICHHATLPSIFHDIYLPVRSREALQRDGDTLIKTLSRSDSMCHVRSLSIKGSFKMSSKPRTEGYKSGGKDRHSKIEADADEVLGDDRELHLDGPHVVYDESVIEKSSDEDLAWGSVVRFVKTLPHLSKLVYDCWNQFPPSLLDALHDHQPQCKLYHFTFRFRTLLWGTPYPYEMALATSPCLYSVKVESCWRDSAGDDDFNQEAAMELAAGLSPNLKEIVVMDIEAENCRRYWPRKRETWRGLPGYVPGRSLGSLTSLSLPRVRSALQPGMLQAWAEHTDFSLLRNLSLGRRDEGITVDMMEWMVQNCSFPRVETLRLHLSRDKFDVEQSNYAITAIALLDTFGSLEQLSLSGPLEPEILDAILNQHGHTLQNLSLLPSEPEGISGIYQGQLRIPMTFTQEHILKINAYCPKLQQLSVSVKRTKSNALEVATYKSFGKLKQLKSLFITLDCSDWWLSRDPDLRDDAALEAAAREISIRRESALVDKGYVQDTLRNCAVDETLARSIWDTICENKEGQKLESLKLWTTGGGKWGRHFGVGNISQVIDNLSRSWRVAREDEDIINVRELNRKVREARDLELTKLYERRAEHLRDNLLYHEAKEDVDIELQDIAEALEEVQVFRCVWPRKKGSKDWREDWSSLPLQG